MKRIILYCILLVIALAVPVNRIDISDLEPIEIVKMDRQNERIILQTDTGDTGSGENVQQALEDLKQHSAGIVYLDTAEYLVVTEDAREYIGSMKTILKGKVRVSGWEGEEDMTEVAKYMKAHKQGIELKQWVPEMALPEVPQKIWKNSKD